MKFIFAGSMKKYILVSIFTFVLFSLQAQYSKTVIVEPVLITDTTSIGQKIIYPQFENNEVTISKVTIPPGQSTGWHKHLIPVYAYILQGTLTVEVKNKKPLVFSKDAAFAEMIDVFHNGVNLGTEDVVLIAFYLGEKRKALSVH